MHLTPEQLHEVRAFCARVLAVDEHGDQFVGRCVLLAGRKRGASKRVLSPITITDDTTAETLEKEIIRALGIISTEGEHPRVYLVTYAPGASGSNISHDAPRFDFDGEESTSLATPTDLDFNDPRVMFGATAAAVERQNLHILNNNRDLLHAVLALTSEMGELRARCFIAETVGSSNAQAAAAERMAAMTEQLMPIVAQIMPMLAAGFAGWGQAQAANARAAAQTPEASDPTEDTDAVELAPEDVTIGIVDRLQSTLHELRDRYFAAGPTFTDEAKTKLQSIMEEVETYKQLMSGAPLGDLS